MELAIIKKRERLIDCANTYGLTDEKTLKYSQELDQLINEYQRFFQIREETENYSLTIWKMAIEEPCAAFCS